MLLSWVGLEDVAMMDPLEVRKVVESAYLRMRGGVGRCALSRWCDDVPCAPAAPDGVADTNGEHIIIDDVGRVAVRAVTHKRR